MELTTFEDLQTCKRVRGGEVSTSMKRWLSTRCQRSSVAFQSSLQRKSQELVVDLVVRASAPKNQSPSVKLSKRTCVLLFVVLGNGIDIGFHWPVIPTGLNIFPPIRRPFMVGQAKAVFQGGRATGGLKPKH